MGNNKCQEHKMQLTRKKTIDCIAFVDDVAMPNFHVPQSK